MDPPPPRNPNTAVASDEPTHPSNSDDVSTSTSTSTSTPLTSMKPPPPKFLSKPDSNSSQSEPVISQSGAEQPAESANAQLSSSSSSVSKSKDDNEDKKKDQRPSASVPYTIPTWSGRPCHQFYLEVLKDGSIIDKFDVHKKGAYMFGRVDLCDFVLEHPTISRFHAVLQFKGNGSSYVYDLGSTHGTFVNKNEVKKRVFVELHVGDVLRFGQSSRLYIFQGPTDLMPPEADLKRVRQAKIQEEMHDMEASLLRAKLEASRADGISWGMSDDAIEENEDEVDEITWQTYKGQLTEKQEKTREKVLKRLEKIAHMKKEIDAIRAKDISQGGLTQGQQTQIARNEQRTSQIMEELENLEETLNDSIRESLGARAGRTSRGKKKEPEEEEFSSEEDEFYDRTQKPSKRKTGENQSIETADSLLDKKDAIIREMEDKRKSFLDEKGGAGQGSEVEAGDELDAYMSGLSSQLALEKKEKLHKELSTLQTELDRVLYLLKIADPTGEAAKKRELKVQEPKTSLIKTVATDAHQQPPPEKNKKDTAERKGLMEKQDTIDANSTSSQETKKEIVADAADVKNVVYTVSKPQWLGAVEEKQKPKQETVIEPQTELQENDQFVDYKDRNKVLVKPDATELTTDSGIESAAPGLIIRKRKQVVKSDATEVKDSQQSSGADMQAEDAVALLLKHSQRFHSTDDEVGFSGHDVSHESQTRKEKKKQKKVLGPERPSYLKSEDYDSWVPPEGQSGDGRTSLNDRLGY
ncbi:putative protein GAST1-like [Capsicum annuum]|uniref:FHA domain-containing protein n=2 Tax=Capsicum annuum TaxID=4072 RepID=A0A2G3ABR3_CAPAN|nr:putative protein GAST1-like [Capsicum annuum]KAF3653350.1 putative protein GAST1-like [Capsicum annuum]PHT91665.1 hypothetical protein T459_06778 [Capsicum annuum]